MHTFKTSFRGPRGLFSSGSMAGVLAVLVLLAGMFPAPVEAQGHRGDFGRGFGPRYGGGIGLGFGLGLLGGLAFNNVYAGYPYVVNTYTVPPPVYYYPQTVPQYVVVNTAPAPSVVYAPAPAAAAPATPAAPSAPVTSAVGKTGRIVYDSNSKPVGVIVSNADGSQEFVPLTQ